MCSTTDVPASQRVHGASIKLKSALVTGATGHIGSALVRRLAGDGVRVTCLVRKGSPARPRLQSVPQVSAIEIAGFEPHGLRKSLQDVRPDVVFNLASAGVNPSDREPLAMLEGNVHLLAGLLCSLESRQPPRLIHTGSCSEFAPAEPGHRLTEDDPLGPSSLYGAAKLSASTYGSALAAERGIPFLNLRLFGVFGAGEAPHRLVPYLIEKLRDDQPVDLTPGEQVRDWLYVDDVVTALLAAATHSNLGSAGVYNVCSGQAVSVREIAEQVAETMNKPKELLRFGARAYRSDETMWIVGDSRRFREATAWLPRVPLAEGIGRMVARPA